MNTVGKRSKDVIQMFNSQAALLVHNESLCMHNKTLKQRRSTTTNK